MMKKEFFRKCPMKNANDSGISGSRKIENAARNSHKYRNKEEKSTPEKGICPSVSIQRTVQPTASQVLQELKEIEVRLAILCETFENALLLNADEHRSLKRRVGARFRAIHSWLDKEEEAVMKELDCRFYDSRQRFDRAFKAHQEDLNALSALKTFAASSVESGSSPNAIAKKERWLKWAIKLTETVNKRIKRSEKIEPPARVSAIFKSSMFWLVRDQLPIGKTVEVSFRQTNT